MHLVLLPRAEAQVHGTYWSPPIQVFDTDTHPGDEAFYALAQDAHGSIIAGNSWGPVTFTGLRWELVPMPPPAYQPVYSLARAEDRVWFTAQQDFGYLDENESGRTRYVSLRSRVAEQTGTDFGPGSVHRTAQGVSFVARDGVVDWSEGQARYWPSPSPLRGGSVVDGGLILLQEDGSLCRPEGDRCRMLLPSDAFQSPIRFLLELDGPDVLIGLDSGEMFMWQPGAAPAPFRHDALAYLGEHGPYSGTVLRDGSMFLWTFRKGGVWLSPEGRMLGILDNEHTDIPNTTINHALEDQDGDLWLATNTALVHVALHAPVAVMPRFGPDDLNVVGGATVDGQLYLGTNDGLWTRTASSSAIPRFESLGAGTGRIFRMGAVDGTPFVFSEGHLLAVEDGVALETGVTGGRDIVSGPRDPAEVWTGTGSGIARTRRDAETGHWKLERAYELGHNVMDVAWDKDGVLWTTVEPGAVLRVEFNPESTAPTRVDHFVQVEDYPMDISQVESVWGTVVFVSDAGLVTPALEHPDTFVPIEIEGGPFLDSPGISGNIFADGRNTLVAQFPDGINIAEDRKWRPGLLPISRDARPLALDETEGGRHLWSWRKGRLLRHDLDAVDSYPSTWTLRIRRAWAGDSLTVLGPEPVSIRRGIESMHFEIAAPRFRDMERLRVRHRLVGLEDTWSEPVTASRIDYNVLKPGTYTLELQGIDAQGFSSDVRRISFVIRPPWYRSDGAMGGWMIVLLGLMGVATYRWQHNRVLVLERRERELEEQVAVRTQEIASQKSEIETQAARLKELDASKSRFFANVSHEFRTPLTLITAPILDALDGDYGPLPSQAVRAFERARLNADRLLRLVDQLLDLARLESGQLKVTATRQDMGAFCRRIVHMIAHAAEQRGIRMDADVPEDVLPVYMDAAQMEKVVVNLLSNAIKFTSEGGRIRLTVYREGGGCVVSVADTGIGIPEQALPRVFERFFQVDDGSIRAHEGMGIGLAMSRQFVQLHGGTMTVESTLGEGSTFSFWLPCEVNRSSGSGRP